MSRRSERRAASRIPHQSFSLSARPTECSHQLTCLSAGSPVESIAPSKTSLSLPRCLKANLCYVRAITVTSIIGPIRKAFNP
jgi:hypothetical protein